MSTSGPMTAPPWPPPANRSTASSATGSSASSTAAITKPLSGSRWPRSPAGRRPSARSDCMADRNITECHSIGAAGCHAFAQILSSNRMPRSQHRESMRSRRACRCFRGAAARRSLAAKGSAKAWHPASLAWKAVLALESTEWRSAPRRPPSSQGAVDVNVSQALTTWFAYPALLAAVPYCRFSRSCLAWRSSCGGGRWPSSEVRFRSAA